MKYLVVSDLHGSLQAAETVVRQNKELNPDAILCLGDVLYHGPRNDVPADYAPKQVIALLNPLATHMIAIRGNCDAEVDQMVLKFALTADYNEFLLGHRLVFMSHGHVFTPINHPQLPHGSIFLSGHTHIPTAEFKDGIYELNPGSLGIPKGGFPKSYGLLNENSFTVSDLDGNSVMSVEFNE